MVNNSANWRPKAVEIHRRLQRGDIGEIRHVQATFHVSLAFIFEDKANTGWIQTTGTVDGEVANEFVVMRSSSHCSVAKGRKYLRKRLRKRLRLGKYTLKMCLREPIKKWLGRVS